MKTNRILIFALTLFSPNLFAYGSGSSTKTCTKPEFSNFTPAHLTEVSKGSKFSFVASKITSPSTIKVTVKRLATNVEIRETPQGFQVSGKLPESLHDTFARINIEAKSHKRCYGSGGWLVKIVP